MTPFSRGTRVRGVLALADISGYTGFLQGVSDAHHDIIVEAEEPPVAYALISGLLDSLAGAVVPPFRLAKFEGDALFVVADDPVASLQGEGLLDCLRGCHAAFTERLGRARDEWTCTCDACARVESLGLKFVVHHGGWVTQRIVDQVEVAGTDVIVVHRLLKNHARHIVGPVPYALISDAAMAALSVPFAGLMPITETYDDLAPVPAHVLALG